MYKLKSTGLAQLPCRTEKGRASSLEIMPFISTTIDLLHKYSWNHFRALFVMPNLCSSIESMMLRFMVLKATDRLMATSGVTHCRSILSKTSLVIFRIADSVLYPSL